MSILSFSAYLLESFLRITNRSILIEVLSLKHREQAIRLFMKEFCNREPLCRFLGIKEHDIEDLFSMQIDYIIAKGLSTVAVDQDGKVLGAIAIEDHLAPFVLDNSKSSNVNLNIIFNFLDTLKLPPAMHPGKVGEVYYYGLIAVNSACKRKDLILSLMILTTCRVLKAKGYLRGYGKVTNFYIAKQIKKLNRLLRSEIITPCAEIFPAEFIYEKKFPLQNFSGSVCLYSWQI